MFTLKVGEGATLQDGNNNNLPLNENRQYITDMDFSGDATHSFTVTAQDGIAMTTYTIGISQQQMGSKEILSFAFQETDNSHLKANIVMDIDPNSRTVTKTVTNVEGITGLVPTIIHNGSNISPASGVAQNFSTDNTYTITAIDKSTADYTVTLTSYYGVIFNASGGLISGNPTVTEYVLYGEKTTPPSDPSQSYYGFKGWYDAPSGGNVFDFTITEITTQTIVYAQWTNKQYKVSFNTDGGGAINPVIVNSLTPVAKPIDPTTNHYVLENWYTDSTLTTRYDFNWVVSNDLILYAKYINKQYQVRFYQGADLLDTVSVVSLTAIPSSDYPVYPISEKVYKWYSDDALNQIYDISTQITNDLDLYAEIISGFQKIIEDGMIPVSLSSYGKMSEQIFSRYDAGADVIARYVKETGTGNGNGSSWDNATNDIKSVIDGINDASENKIYVVLVASGAYKPSNSYVMKNYVVLVGGFTAGSYDQTGETRLDGNNDKRVFNNDNNGLDRTALLYGVVITNGGNVGAGGGGMNNRRSSPTLINVTFSGNTANGNGGGMRNSKSSPTLINVIFSDNEATEYGGGISNDSDEKPLTLINTILWGNNNGNIYLHNDSANTTEIINLYYSLIEGGTTPSTTAEGIRLYNGDTNANPININSEEVITGDPGLGSLADNGGEVSTISISSSSLAKDAGAYVRGVKSNTGNPYPEANLYYSENNTDWYSDPGLTTQESPPSDADDLTATDVRGYGRVGRTDMGAYEEGGTAP